MTLSTLPAAPEGFQIVTQGNLRPGDLVWNPYDESWGGPMKVDIDALGRHIPFYYAAARKPKIPTSESQV
ncbi:hypothetical protein IFT48_02590 [Pseudomonas fluorescens]|uniref:hypothetical protein n=1 Tax=Pseudomonas TaxID=286 RepID=UPI000F029C1E|nr:MULTISPECIES: hypothetical protein [Pseudomonas]MBD8088853.1 hypothetical protein [Pseudomonas fluorescens]